MMSASIGSFLAKYLPRDVIPKCPKCGGRLMATVTIYVTVPVFATVMDGYARVKATHDIRETKAELMAQVDDAPAGDGTGETDELRCARCDYWVRVFDLEASL